MGRWGEDGETMIRTYFMDFQYKTFLKKKLSKNKLIDKKKICWTQEDFCNTAVIAVMVEYTVLQEERILWLLSWSAKQSSPQGE